MPSRHVAEEMTNFGSTIGEELKRMSDFAVDSTWGNDIGDQVAYLYNYATDNEPLLRRGMTQYQKPECQKHPVNIRFLITAYKSAAKDDAEAHIIFKPNDWNTGRVIPDWWKDKQIGGVDYQSLDIDFPIGCYIDIKNDKGIYERWLIVYTDHANQFKKFGIMRCNHLLQWVTNSRTDRYIRQAWCVERTQNSYNSGVYQYNKFQVLENQGKIYLPYNNITNELYYNQRLIVSLPTVTPLTWLVSKVENTLPKGINYITLYQDEFNSDTDVAWGPDDAGNPLPGQWCMLADYHKRPVAPKEEPDVPPVSDNTAKITCGTTQIYIGRSKTLTVNCYDGSGNDVTSSYSSFAWSYSIDNEDASTIIAETTLTDSNKIKITFNGNEDYAFKTLKVTCTATGSNNASAVATLDIGILA